MSTRILIKESCQECAATGHVAYPPELDPRPCPRCDGRGYVLRFVGLEPLIREAVRDIVEQRR